MKRHNKYIDELRIGDLIAFRLYENDAKMYSGKVVKIGKTRIEVQTKNGQRYYVDKTDVQWVNNKGFWPKFVMSAFKGIDMEDDEEVDINVDVNVINNTEEIINNIDNDNNDNNDIEEKDTNINNDVENKINITTIAVEKESEEDATW